MQNSYCIAESAYLGGLSQKIVVRRVCQFFSKVDEPAHKMTTVCVWQPHCGSMCPPVLPVSNKLIKVNSLSILILRQIIIIKLESTIILNNRYLGRLENDFVGTVTEEVTAFLNNYRTSQLDKVLLVFPASLPSKYRYLIHEIVSQLFSEFRISTISIGRENRRRTCLFFTDVISQLKMSQNNEAAVDVKASESSDSSENAKISKKHKRPDKPLYVPPGSKSSKCNEDTENTDCHQKEDKEKCCKENNEPSWDSLYDDSGDVIDKEFVNDLNSELEIRAVRNQLTATTLDYSKFTTNEWGDDSQTDTGTILEAYDFVSDLKTRDLVSSLSSTK